MRPGRLQTLQRTRFEEMVNLHKVLNAVFIAALLAIGMISINVIRGSVNPATLSVVGLFFLSGGLYLVYWQGYYRIAGVGLIVAISVVVTYNFLVSGGIHDNAMVIFPVLITIAGLVIGKRFIPYLTGLFLVEVTGIYILTLTGVIAPFGGNVVVRGENFVTVLILMIISGIVIWITVDTLERNFLKIIDSERNLRQSYDETIKVWGKALELFDRDTEGHSRRVSELALALGRKLGMGEQELIQLERGALLHDIGKMGIDEQVLNKPESLSEEERRLVETHPLNAHKLLRDIPFLEKAMDVPVYHHECWDGSGYPFQLVGEEIPVFARIFAIVDNWDALRSDRPYRKAWPKDKVQQYLRNQGGKKFDPALVEIFISLVE